MIPASFHTNTARHVLGQRAAQDAIAAFNRKYGFNDPIIVQYWHYIYNLFHGNFGTSFNTETLYQPVSGIILPAVWETLWIVLIAILVSLLIAIPLGMFQSLKRNSVFDYVATGAVFLLYSIPAFLFGILLVITFSVYWHLLPPQVIGTYGTGPWAKLLAILQNPKSYIMPIAVLVGLSVGGYSRFMRGSVLDVLVQDYVRTARAKGASTRRVLFRHALRNAIIPILTILGLSLPALFSGAIITE